MSGFNFRTGLFTRTSVPTQSWFSTIRGVTTPELWKALGDALTLRRKDRGWNHSDVERQGGPNYKTVANHERGRIIRVDKLEAHVNALGWTLSDLLRAVLGSAEQPLSPEAAQVVRVFQRTTVAGRQALLALAVALPLAAGEPQAPHPPRDAPAEKAAHKR